MSDLLNNIVFKRLISLRKELGLTQQEFVDNFNEFIAVNKIVLINKSNNPLKTDNYSNIERRLSSQTETFIHIVKYYQVVHDINPGWLFVEDNLLVSKYISKDLEIERYNLLEQKHSLIKGKIKELQALMKD